MRIRFLTLCVLAFLSLCGTKERYSVSDSLLNAIQSVESGDAGDNAPDGDGGKAIGPFQIRKEYWKDATEFDKTIGGTYADCHKLEYATKVVRAYMRRYVPVGSTDETAARIHNGGPKGATKKATEKYWEKVKKALK